MKTWPCCPDARGRSSPSSRRFFGLAEPQTGGHLTSVAIPVPAQISELLVGHCQVLFLEWCPSNFNFFFFTVFSLNFLGWLYCTLQRRILKSDLNQPGCCGCLFWGRVFNDVSGKRFSDLKQCHRLCGSCGKCLFFVLVSHRWWSLCPLVFIPGGSLPPHWHAS